MAEEKKNEIYDASWLPDFSNHDEDVRIHGFRPPKGLQGYLSWLTSSHLRIALHNQFTSVLLAKRVFEGADGFPERQERSRAATNELMARKRNWVTTHLIELLSIGSMEPEMLDIEMERRLADAEELKLRELTFYKSQHSKLSSSKKEEIDGRDERLFQILFQLVADCQSITLSQKVKRQYARVYNRRMYSIFVFAFFVLILTLFFHARPDAGKDPLALPGLSGFWLAIVAGVFGAAFSMISQPSDKISNATLDDLRSMSKNVQMLSRVSLGAGGAAILYFMFNASLIDGVVFPDIHSLGFTNVGSDLSEKPPLGSYVPNKELAALMVWSFLAGFSERLVPSFLGRIETSSNETR